MWQSMRKINEIFHSLQGEGANMGKSAVFVRFSGCNLRCSFCDTHHEDGKMMTDDEIVDAIKDFPAEWIVLTGGEPSLWIDDEFIRLIKNRTGKKVAIETNGSRELPDTIDWVTVSPKCGMDGAGVYEIKVSHADELKVVETGQDLEQYFSLRCVDGDTLMYLQPCFVEDAEECFRNRQRTIERVLDDSRWTLSVQLHRFLGIR